MTIIRREHRAHFTIVPNAVFADTRLSIEAKGVLGYLLSRPRKWRVRPEHVARTLNVGRKKLQRIFRELIGAGYVTREPQRFVNGHRFGDLDYVVRDVPLALAGPVGNSGAAVENSTVPRVDARLDAAIVERFADKAEGWEFLTMLPQDALARLRQLQRRGKIDEAALVDLWNQYGHFVARRRPAR